MRLEIKHRTSYRYEQPVRFSAQYLRLTPYGNRSQRVVRWRIDVPGSLSFHEWHDGFGNTCHTLGFHEPVDEIVLEAHGVVETTDVAGVLPAEDFAMPIGLFLRQTTLTEIDGEIAKYAENYRSAVEKDRLDGLHKLSVGIAEAVEYRTDTTVVSSRAADVLADGYGVCQDQAHVFIACTRHLGIPARYVSGYLYTGDQNAPYVAGHAWAAAWVPDLGWVSFDIANGMCGTERHVGIATGLDYADALPVRGVRHGDSGQEGLSVEVEIQPVQQ